MRDEFFVFSQPRPRLPKKNRPPPPLAPRRASPPRPSLLLGGIPQCELELAKLQQAYRELMGKDDEEEHKKEEAPSNSSPEWSRLVSRFRWLRETLVSCGAGLATPLGLAAAASGADTALRARDWGEFLKSVSYLASDGVVCGAATEEAASTPSSSLSPPPASSSVSTFASSSLYVPHEADALLLLYFSCVPPQPQSLDVATRLRALAMRRRRRQQAGEEEEKGEAKDGENEKTPPSSSPSHPLPPPIELSVAVHIAMATGDGLALARLFRSHPACSWRTRALMAPALERSLWSASSSSASASSSSSSAASAPPPPPPTPSPPLPVRGGYPAALAALAASYRSLPVAVARRLMGIGCSSARGEEEGAGAQEGEKLLGELVAVARSRGDRWALAATAEELPPAGELKFK